MSVKFGKLCGSLIKYCIVVGMEDDQLRARLLLHLDLTLAKQLLLGHMHASRQQLGDCHLLCKLAKYLANAQNQNKESKQTIKKGNFVEDHIQPHNAMSMDKDVIIVAN